jgi:two-component system nitrogen regulation response regulator GlnG
MNKRIIADVSTAAGRHSTTSDPGPPLVPVLTIASHPTVARAGDQLSLDALTAGREVALSRNAPDFLKRGSALGRPLDDPFLSRKAIRFTPAASGGVRVLAGDGGPIRIAGAEVRDGVDFSADEVAAGVPIELAGRVVLLLHLGSPTPVPALDAFGMVGASAGIERVRRHLERLADLSIPVLLRGETGTGKELVARAVHTHSPRRHGPFVSVNLGAIPRELAAAELFGALKGAFTGATRDREGFFGAARGGTLFLDEVGEAPPEVQVMLLRVLETREMYPVGGQTPVATDVRLIAATDADLDAQIREGRFKAPLLHRLAGYEIRLPALRDRREDIGLLFHHFAQQELAAIGESRRLAPDDPYADPWLPATLAVRLLGFSWPGNIRQLRNLTRQLVIGSRGQAQLTLDPRLADELSPATARASSAPQPPSPSPSTPAAPRRKASEVTDAELLSALRACEWDIKPTADRLRIPRSSIYDRIARCPGVRTAGDVSAEEITRSFEGCGGDVTKMVEQLQVSRQALKRRLKEMGLGRAE